MNYQITFFLHRDKITILYLAILITDIREPQSVNESGNNVSPYNVAILNYFRKSQISLHSYLAVTVVNQGQIFFYFLFFYCDPI